MSFVNYANIKKKSFARAALVLISGLVFFTIIRSSWSPNANLNDKQFTSKWEKMFKTATNAVVNNFMSNSKSPQNVNCVSSTDWHALLDSDIVTGPQLLEYFMWTNHSSCQLSRNFGGVMMSNPSGLEGEKTVCIDPKVAPRPDDCLVYSFGIKNEWSFDEKMSAYGCQVFAFDPSMNMPHHDHSPGNVHFYNWGLGDNDEYDYNLNWTIHSLSTIYKKVSGRHDHKIIDYLKLDIEWSEWIALPQIIASGMLANVRQLGMEIHFDGDATLKQLVTRAKRLRTIEKMGMVRFHSEPNQRFMGIYTHFPMKGSFGYEIAWYNSNLTHVVT